MNSIHLAVVEAFLCKGLSHRQIQKSILKTEAPVRGGGFEAMNILHSYGITAKHKKMLYGKPFDRELFSQKRSITAYLDAMSYSSSNDAKVSPNEEASDDRARKMKELKDQLDKIDGIEETLRFKSISEFINNCQKYKIKSVDATIAYRVHLPTNRVATFDWMFSAQTNGKRFEGIDELSACWFDDGYPFPAEESNSFPFSTSNARKGSQFERVGAFLSQLDDLDDTGIEINSMVGADIEIILSWARLVANCIGDNNERKKFDAMFNGIPKVRQSK